MPEPDCRARPIRLDARHGVVSLDLRGVREWEMWRRVQRERAAEIDNSIVGLRHLL